MDSESGDELLQRRLLKLEHEHAQLLQVSNEQSVQQESRIARLRSSLEQAEASRRSVELELTIAKKCLSDEQETALAKVSDLSKQNDELRGQAEVLTHQNNHLRSCVQESSQELRLEKERMAARLLEKADELHALRGERDALNANLTDSLQRLKEEHGEFQKLQSKFTALEDDHGTQQCVISRQAEEFGAMMAREEQLNSRLHVAQERIQQLEKAVEAERSSHMETKFKGELLQLQIQELTTSLESEKKARQEAVMNIEVLQDQLREEECTLTSEKQSNTNLRDEVARMNRKRLSEQNAFTAQLQDKEQTVKTLSDKLMQMQETANALRKDLSEISTRHKQLEQKHERSLAELQKILERFCQGIGLGQARTKMTNERHKTHKLLDLLKEATEHCQGRIRDTSSQVMALKRQVEKLSSENSAYRELVVTRDMSVKDAQRQLVTTSTQLAQARSALTEAESCVAHLRAALDQSKRSDHGHKLKMREIKEELAKFQEAVSEDARAKCGILHTLYQQLVAGRVLVSSPNQPEIGGLDWSELVSLVSKQVATVISDKQQMLDKVSHLEKQLLHKQQEIEELHLHHEEAMAKVSSATKDREQAWHEQRVAQDAHFSQLIAAAESKMKQAQGFLVDTRSKLQTVSTGRDLAAGQCAALQKENEQLKEQQNAMESSAALLAGALWPASACIRVLSEQKQLLLVQVGRLEAACLAAHQLAETMNSDLQAQCSNDSSLCSSISGAFAAPFHPLLQFRIAVVAVLAANRLRCLGHQSRTLFISHVCPQNAPQNLAVAVSQTDLQTFSAPAAKQQGFLATLAHSSASQRNGKCFMAWVQSSRLKSVLTSSMRQLTALFKMSQEKEATATDCHPLVGNDVGMIARESFGQLIQSLDVEFVGSMKRLSTGGYASSWTLVHRLGCGLQQSLMRLSRQSRCFKLYVPAGQPIGLVRSHILQLIQDLHSSEVLCHRRQQQLIQEQQAAHGARCQVDELKCHLQLLERKAQGMVPVDRYESVCAETNSAIQREKALQIELAHHVEHAKQIRRQMEKSERTKSSHEAALSQAVQDLAGSNAAVRRKEQSITLLTQQINQLEQHITACQAQLKDVQGSLLTAHREKTDFLDFFQLVNQAAAKIKAENLGAEDAKRCLQKVLRAAPQLNISLQQQGFTPVHVTVEEMVNMLVECMSQVCALQREKLLQEEHIATLRRELNAACRRQLSEAAVQLANSVVEDEAADVTLASLESFFEPASSQGGQPNVDSSRFGPLQGRSDKLTTHPHTTSTPVQKRNAAPTKVNLFKQSSHLAADLSTCLDGTKS